jgi:hypothetical protein
MQGDFVFWSESVGLHSEAERRDSFLSQADRECQAVAKVKVARLIEDILPRTFFISPKRCPTHKSLMPSEVPNQWIDLDIVSSNPMADPRMRIGSPDRAPDVALFHRRDMADAKVRYSKTVE